MLKTCSACRLQFPLEMFSRDASRPSGLNPRCKACVRVMNQRRTPESILTANLRRYGLTPETWQQLFDEQQGRCKICETPHEVRPLHVDHNHKTGKVRGLLCTNCNTAIGKLQERPDLFRRAIEYLEESSDRSAVQE